MTTAGQTAPLLDEEEELLLLDEELEDELLLEEDELDDDDDELLLDELLLLDDEPPLLDADSLPDDAPLHAASAHADPHANRMLLKSLRKAVIGLPPILLRGPGAEQCARKTPVSRGKASSTAQAAIDAPNEARAIVSWGHRVGTENP